MDDVGKLVAQIQTNVNTLRAQLKDYFEARTGQTPQTMAQYLNDIENAINNSDLKPEAMDEVARKIQSISDMIDKAIEILDHSPPKRDPQLVSEERDKLRQIKGTLDALKQLTSDLKTALEQQQKPAQPTTSPPPAELIKAVKAFVSLIKETLIPFYNQYPIITQREEQGRLLKIAEQVLAQYDKIRPEIVGKIKIIQNYTGLTFSEQVEGSSEQAKNFLTQAQQKLRDDIETLLRGSASQQLGGEKSEWESELAAASQELREIEPIDIEKAAFVLGTGAEIESVVESLPKQITLRDVGRALARFFGSLIRLPQEAIEQAVPTETEKRMVDIIRIIRESSERKLKIIRDEKELEEPQTPDDIYRELGERLRRLWFSLRQLTPKRESLERLPEDFRDLIENWIDTANKLANLIHNISQKQKPFKWLSKDLWVAFDNFLNATGKLITERRLSEDDKEKLRALHDELIQIKHLYTLLQPPEQASKSFVRLDRLLPFSLDDLKHQRWLVEEKHTL